MGQFWIVLYKKSIYKWQVLQKNLSLCYSVLSWSDVICLPVGLYSILNPALVADPSEWKSIKISLLDEAWLGGIEVPQYFPIMGDELEPPS